MRTSSHGFHLPLEMKFVALSEVNAPKKVSCEFVLACLTQEVIDLSRVDYPLRCDCYHWLFPPSPK